MPTCVEFGASHHSLPSTAPDDPLSLNESSIALPSPPSIGYNGCRRYELSWSKFSTAPAFGVIYKGYLDQGMSTILPQSGSKNAASGAAYSKGGALYAVGLTHIGCKSPAITYLGDTLEAVQGEIA
jgi:hypothetical protein